MFFQNFGIWGRLNQNSFLKPRFNITCFKRGPGLELVGALASDLQAQSLTKKGYHCASTLPFNMHFNAIFALLKGQVACLANTARVDLVTRQSPPLRHVQKGQGSFRMFLQFQHGPLGKVKLLQCVGLTVGCSSGGIRKPGKRMPR